MYSDSPNNRFSNPYIHGVPFEQNSTNDSKVDVVKIIFKGVCIIGIIAITILAGKAIPGIINRLGESIGKDFTYTDYIRSVNGYIIPIKYTQTFTSLDYYVSLLGLGILSCIGLGISGALIAVLLGKTSY